MPIGASELRKNLFSILDDCVDSGAQYEVKRKHGVVVLKAERRRLRVAELKPRPGVLVDGGTLDSFSPAEWRP